MEKRGGRGQKGGEVTGVYIPEEIFVKNQLMGGLKSTSQWGKQDPIDIV